VDLFKSKYSKYANVIKNLETKTKPFYYTDIPVNNLPNYAPKVGISKVLEDYQSYNIRMEKIEQLKILINERHKNTYGENKFIYHIEKVLSVLKRYGISNILDDDIYNIMQGAILHDILEDTDMTAEALEKYVSKKVIELVKRLTDQPGKTRALQKEKTYPNILGNKSALLIKLADRIANTQEAQRIKSRDNGKFLNRYVNEFPIFKRKLNNGENLAMWQELSRLTLTSS